MSANFDAYNLHRIKPEQYWELDNHLRVLSKQPYVYQHPLIAALPRDTPGIYTIGGGRQIGKTTLLKQWIASLITQGVAPQHIIFFTGELIDDHHALVDLLAEQSKAATDGALHYIIIDEVTYIDAWDRGIKFAADAGYLHNSVVVLTGSDLTLMQSARMTFPGRRGRADKVDYHIHSLSFRAFCKLKQSIDGIDDICAGTSIPTGAILNQIFHEFNEYLKHGGYLTAINDMAHDGMIHRATLKTYSDWIRGDMLKRGKQEKYLKEIIVALIERYNKQVSWHNLADAVSIDSPKTVSDYCELLSSMDALFIQSALVENKLVGAPKKARKLTFTDPFIYHALKLWVTENTEPHQQVEHDIADPIIASAIVEAIASNHYSRIYPTYYIKAKGEIDIAYIHQKKCWPVEVKWRNQLRPKDIKQLLKYPRCKILSKTPRSGSIEGIPIVPLPLELLLMKEGII